MNKISVIIPIYNVDKYLSACLDSVIYQTYRNLEIILVNDGSTDRSKEIIEHYIAKDDRIKVIHQENAGVAVARNMGLDIMTGDYLGFVDSDDIIAPHFYETLLNNALENNADIIECDFSKVESEIGNQNCLKEKKYVSNYNTRTALELLMKEKIKQVLWNKLYKKNIIQGIQFEEGKINEDDFWSYQIFGNAKSVTKIFTVLYFYRQHSESIMGKTYNTKRLDGLVALENRINYMKLNFPELENLAIKIFCLASLFHYQKVDKQYEIDPQKIFRNIMVASVKKYNKIDILKRWTFTEIFWYQFFITTPSFCTKFRNYINIGI